MKEFFAEKLRTDYPQIFDTTGVGGLPRKFHFECSDGWYWLIDNLCHAIQHYQNSKECVEVKAMQVKEKFGGLRFYIGPAPEEIHSYIYFAEQLSYTICEICGDTHTAKLRNTNGWLMTRCDKCYKKKGEK